MTWRIEGAVDELGAFSRLGARAATLAATAGGRRAEVAARMAEQPSPGPRGARSTQSTRPATAPDGAPVPA